MIVLTLLAGLAAPAGAPAAEKIKVTVPTAAVTFAAEAADVVSGGAQREKRQAPETPRRGSPWLRCRPRTAAHFAPGRS
jgi:hypothetical protein